MNTHILNRFVTDLLEDRVEFSNTFGTDKLMNVNYMLVSDALSENVEQFSELIKEHIQEKIDLPLTYIRANNTHSFIR